LGEKEVKLKKRKKILKMIEIYMYFGSGDFLLKF
jgi:hypothetical protein